MMGCDIPKKKNVEYVPPSHCEYTDPSPDLLTMAVLPLLHENRGFASKSS
jgi:hypothetical protein